LGRFCIPTFQTYYYVLPGNITLASPTNNNQTSSFFNANFINTDKVMDYISDLSLVWPILLASIGIALVITLFYLFFVRFCAGVIAYTTILLILAALIGLGYLFQHKIPDYQQAGDERGELAMKIFCGFFYSLGIIWFLMILFMCNRIRLAVALSEVTAEYLSQKCSVYLIPFFFIIVSISYCCFWVAVSVFLYSSGKITTQNNNAFIASVEW
jgi:choline transporter-like protein 2/4/5